MKRILLGVALAGPLLWAGLAQADPGTDAARARAAQADAAQVLAEAARAPRAEAAPGDYEAAAHDAVRLAQWQAERAAVQAYAAGARSQPLPVHSDLSARAEARRLTAQHNLALEAGSASS